RPPSDLSGTQVLREKLGSRARIVALDVLDMAPLPGVVRIQGDFRDEPVVAALEAPRAARNIDPAVSDLAPNLSGIEPADQARAVHLGELALQFACRWLEPGGDLVVKAFQGAGFPEFHRELERRFRRVC